MNEGPRGLEDEFDILDVQLTQKDRELRMDIWQKKHKALQVKMSKKDSKNKELQMEIERLQKELKHAKGENGD